MDLKTYIMHKIWTYLIYNNIYKILIYSWDIFKKSISKVKIKTVMQKSIIFNAYIHIYIYILIYTIYKYNIDIVIIL